MGAAQSSYITPEAAATAFVVAGAVALGYTQLAPAPAPSKKEKPAKGAKGAAESGVPAVDAAPSKKKKGKKAASATSAGAPAPGGSAVPGAFADEAGAPEQGAAEPEKEKAPKKKRKSAAVAAAAAAARSPAAVDPQSVSASIDFLSASEITPLPPSHRGVAPARRGTRTPPLPAGKKGKKARSKKSTPAGTPAARPTTLAAPAPEQAAKGVKPAARAEALAPHAVDDVARHGRLLDARLHAQAPRGRRGARHRELGRRRAHALGGGDVLARRRAVRARCGEQH